MQELAASGQETGTRPIIPRGEFNLFFLSLVEGEHEQSSMDGVAKQQVDVESVVIS